MTQGEHTTRVFQAGSFTFEVATNQQRLCTAIEKLFADLSVGESPLARFTVSDEADGTLLEGADLVSFVYRRDTSAVLDELVTAVNRLMLDAGGARLHLHAGAVSKDDQTVLVSAPSGTGKTTLVTSLLRHGWTYLTDEAVSVAQGDDRVRSFPKPLSIKPGGRALYPDLADHRVSLGGTESGLWQVPVGAQGIGTALSAAPTMIVVLSRDPYGQTASWQPMTPADATVALIEQSLDFERYGVDALRTVAELCARCRCVHIKAGTPDATADLIEELAFEKPGLGAPPHVASIDDDERPTMIASGVTAVAIGVDAVLRNGTDGRVVSLNSAGAELWTALIGGAPLDDFRGTGAESFVQELIEAGFVRSDGR